MPAAVPEKSGTEKAAAEKAGPKRPLSVAPHMWATLKVYIMKERVRKKQEREAEVEEERLRKEREAREQQNVMTLGQTREKIALTEAKLTQLREEKHQLFLQLKKVLNEDENRRRQLQMKESNDIITIQSLPTSLVHQQLYLPQPTPAATRSAPMPQQTFKTSVKRPRSPSPQPAVPVSLYHQAYGYKPPTVINTSYQSSPQKDDTRRHELVRAVLWNKTAQYANQPGTFYAVPPQELSMYYPHAPMTSREQQRSVYESPRPQAYHIDQQKAAAVAAAAGLEHYAALRPPTTHTHVIHGGSIALSAAQPPSTGSITAGYPMRVQHKPQAPTAALYTTQSRPVYQSPGTPINYPPRE